MRVFFDPAAAVALFIWVTLGLPSAALGLGYLALCFYKVGIIPGCCLFSCPVVLKKESLQSFLCASRDLPARIRSVFLCGEKGPGAGGNVSCSGPSLWSRWPGKGPHGWSLSIAKFVPSDNASSQHSKCRGRTESRRRHSPWKAVGLGLVCGSQC